MIYFLQQGKYGPIKIGYSSRGGAIRKQGLQTGNPTPLVLLAEIPGTKDDEGRLQNRFDFCNVQGTKEWFYPVRELLEYIEVRNEGSKPIKKSGTKKRKTGLFVEIRTIRNRQSGTQYKWRYLVTYVDGERIHSKSLGRL